ncbi:methyl-accepting chemotaxis protein [Devosia sp. FJ2-5-3]|uniref:methyl-accepting chemotaxis protein n=1 Tax=Devosia sp. FJ2-5-3 TaxID=2976680 RepID=UPI0023D803E7|nr:methyl-accepting chemotaxis protein [Devosia sp. FJ2-5-3]WEJ58748.1 methyl-accepting chemotaxis protein [Devosia sp. FJ2-5-3]
MTMFRSVKARIYGAFAALSIVLTVIGGASIYLMSNAEHLFADYRKVARQSLILDEYLRDISLLRIDFLNYLLTPTSQWADAVRAQAKALAEAKQSAPTYFGDDRAAMDVVADASELLTQYSAGFETLVTAVGSGADPRTHSQTALLTSKGPAMFALFSDLSSKAHARQNALGPVIAQQETLQLMIVAAISLIGLIIGVTLAVLTGRWLTGTFTHLTQTMGRLVEGQYDTNIAGTEAQNELGEMARALETFRVNGLEVRAAETEKQRRAGEMAARAEMMARFQAAFDRVIESAMNGDFSARIANQFGEREIDRIAGNLDGMMAAIETALDEADRVLGAMARADLRDRMRGEYRGAFAQLRQSTNSVADKIEEIILQLRDTSRNLKQATGEILAGANDLSERTTRQAATIEETSAAMDQLATTVTSNAEQARKASDGAGRMTHVAEASNAVMQQATQAMERISTSATKISNIIGLIDDIAFQTNLLALNASVEAARAGESGKGFAVVAVEVRRLAQSAAQASADIKHLIEQSGGEVRNGSRLVADVAGRLSEIIEGVRNSAALMSNIANHSQAQAAGISQINVAVRQMDEMTQHNAALVEEMNASIEQTEGQASRVDGIVETFTLRDPSAAARSPVMDMAELARSERAGGARGLIKSVQKAAKTYFGGAAATAEDWSEF